tara:strand:+ start:661 stop:987 length:327 start_codon:yes stop_codon:yes gene_type:complete
MDKVKTYVFDIDGTVCNTNGSDYENSTPLMDRIEKVNALYDAGHTIFFLTARGMGRTDNDQRKAHDLLHEFTRQQLLNWGIKFHRLFLGKPTADFYVDDKGICDTDYF